MLRYLLIILLAKTLIACSTNLTFYVMPTGSDSNLGTKEQPFKTLERARDEVRKLDKTANITVFLRQGIYKLNESLEFDEIDSGVEGKTIIYSAFENENVAVMGGLSLPVESLKKSSKNIKTINLKDLGITNYGKLRNVGFARAYGPSWLELFVNKEAYHLARYPNDSNIRVGKLLDSGSIPGKDSIPRGGKFTYPGKRPSRWAKSNDVWIAGYFNRGWAEDAVQLAEIDTINKTFTTAQPHVYGFGSGKSWMRWYAFNILEELDAPGEYYLDRETGELSFYYDNDESIETIEVSVLEEPMIVLEGADNITFSGITFENSRGIGVYMERTNNIKIENCVLRNLGATAVVIGKGVKPNDAIRQDATLGTPSSREIGSLDLYMYNNTVYNREAGTNNGVINCHIYQVGAGGVSLGGGNRLTLEPGNNYVENCRIHDFNRIEKSYRAGVWVTGVGNRITNCEIYNGSMMAIYLNGNEHLIEYCDIHDVVRDMHDQGALYYGRNPSERGNVVRYNYFHDLGNDNLSVGVYHDDGACDMKVHGNIFYKSGSMPALIGGGNDNRYTNNIFIDSKFGIHIDNRKRGWARKHALKEGGTWNLDMRLNQVDYQKPPYSERYPELVDYWKNEKGKPYPLNNIAHHNLFYKIGKVIDGKKEWLGWQDNYESDGLPDFWDNNKKEFILQDGKIAPAIEGFIPIPFDKIGYKASPNPSKGVE